MRHLTLSFTVLMAMIFATTSLNAQKLSKEEKKFWKDKAKMYVKNPATLKGEMENFQQQITDLKDQLRESMAQNEAAADEALVDSLRWAIIQLEGKLQNQKRQNEQLTEQLGTVNTTQNMGIKAGLVYRVQIGAYVFYEMESSPDNGTNFIAERADGFNKYIVGNFRAYDDAVVFRDELKSMGMDDAWIVPYIDGVRVTIDEAKQYLENQGTSFLNGN